MEFGINWTIRKLSSNGQYLSSIGQSDIFDGASLERNQVNTLDEDCDFGPPVHSNHFEV